MTEVPPPESSSPPQEPAPEAPQAPAGVLRGDRGTDTAQIIMSAFLILVVGAIAYLNVFRVPFQGLDQEYIQDNAALQRLQTVPEATEGPAGAPLTLYTYAVNWHISQNRPWEFRFTDLLLHLANSILLYLVCRRLFQGTLPEPMAMLAGMVFAVHPLGSDAVVYLVGRPALLGTFFALLTVLLWLRGTQQPSPRYGSLAAALCCYVLAFASSFAMLFLPLLLVAVDLGAGAAPKIRAHGRVYALFFGAMLLLLVAQLGTQAAAEAPPPLEEGTVGMALTQGTLRLLSQAVIPLQLHPLPVEMGFSWAGLLLFILLLAGAGAALFASSVAGVALFWACAGLAGAALMLPPETATTERSLYFALAGLSLLVPWVLAQLQEPLSRKVAGGVVAALVIAAGSLTFARTTLWQDPEELWNQAADARPDSPEPWRYLGRFATRGAFGIEDQAAMAGVMRIAADYWERVLDYLPRDEEALAELGKARFGMGEQESASELLREALRLAPFNQQASVFLAMSLEARADEEGEVQLLRRAVDQYEHARRLGPLNPDILTRDAFARIQLGDFEGALPLLAHVAAMEPEGAAAGAFHQVTPLAERVRQLEQQAQEQLEADPVSLAPHLLRVEGYLLRGDLMSAFYLSDRLLRREPQWPEAWAMLGAVSARMERQETFLEQWADAPVAQPPEAWQTLALRTASTGAWAGALDYLEFAAPRLPDAPLPRVVMAEIALQLHQPHLAQGFLQQAAELHPEDPAPWLLLAEMALAAEQTAQAQQFLTEARHRGAPEEVLREHMEDIEIPEDEPRRPPRIIIR